MANFCDRNGNFVSGLRAPKRVFKMEPITNEQGCVCVIESVRGSPYVEDHPKITVTLRSSTSEINSAEINSTLATSSDEYRLDTAFELENLTLPHRNKSALTLTAMNTFSLGVVHEHVRIETACDNSGINRRLQNNQFSSSTGNNLNDAFTLKAQPAVNECDILNAAFPVDGCDNFNLHKKWVSSPTYNEDNGQVVVSPDCDQHETECHLSQTELQNDLTNDCYENTDEDTCFATEIHMLCKNQELFSKSTEHMVAPGSECFSDHAYHNTTLESGRQSSSSDYFNCHLKGENTPVYQNAHEEFHDDSYENIELSSMFSSSDIYQRSFDQNYTANSLSPSQENSDSSSNFINDLDSRSCEKFMADSGIFGLSLSDSGSEFFQSDGMHYPQMISSAQLDISGDTVEPDKDCDLLFSTPVVKSTHTNTALFSTSVANSTQTSAALCSTRVTNSMHTNALFPDPGTRMPDNVQTGCHEHHCDLHHKSTATSTFSSAGLSFCCNAFDKSPSVPQFYDPCLSDYRRYIYHSPYSQAAASTEWKSWTKGISTAYNSPDSLIISKKPTDDSCPVSSTDIRGSVTKPEIVQFIEINAKEDEEETDDADEIDYLPVCFNTNDDQCASHTDPQSVGTTEYHGESPTAGYSPSVLTPPPSASSTPVPSSTQESTSDEMDLSASLPMSHYNTSQTYSSPTGQAFACKLNHKQLEASLLSFGLSQGAKRPYPSMADAMRRSRSKSATRKKYSQEGSDQQPRRSGRPRKTQIQSDTISTTAVSNKQRRKMVLKTKCEPPEQDAKNLISSEDQAGSSRMSGTFRHNEPLKQNAIGIMSQWFEDHIDNPYPSKADKEKMAIQGGITENQVKSWFANKRNRTNNTKPKVQKRAMEEKLKEIFRDLKRNNQNPMADNSHVIQQLSGIIQHCHTAKLT